MLGFIHIAAAAGVVIGGWFVALGSLGWALLMGWAWVRDGISDLPVEGTSAVALDFTLPAGPELSVFAEHLAMVAVVVTLGVLLSGQLTTIRRSLRQALGTPPTRLPAEHPLAKEVSRIAGLMRGRSPSVWIYASGDPQAFALSLIGRDAVCLSSALLERLPAASISWVIAHEVAHVRYGDSLRNSLWCSAVLSTYTAERWHYRVLNLLLRILRLIPAGRLLALVATLPLGLFALASSATRKVVVLVFRLVDRWVSRAAEFRADAQAARLTGAAPGIVALQSIAGPIEPSFSFFATHPSIDSRIARLERFSPKPPQRGQ